MHSEDDLVIWQYLHPTYWRLYRHPLLYGQVIGLLRHFHVRPREMETRWDQRNFLA